MRDKKAVALTQTPTPVLAPCSSVRCVPDKAITAGGVSHVVDVLSGSEGTKGCSFNIIQHPERGALKAGHMHRPPPPTSRSRVDPVDRDRSRRRFLSTCLSQRESSVRSCQIYSINEAELSVWRNPGSCFCCQASDVLSSLPWARPLALQARCLPCRGLRRLLRSLCGQRRRCSSSASALQESKRVHGRPCVDNVMTMSNTLKFGCFMMLWGLRIFCC